MPDSVLARGCAETEESDRFLDSMQEMVAPPFETRVCEVSGPVHLGAAGTGTILVSTRQL